MIGPLQEELAKISGKARNTIVDFKKAFCIENLLQTKFLLNVIGFLEELRMMDTNSFENVTTDQLFDVSIKID